MPRIVLMTRLLRVGCPAVLRDDRVAVERIRSLDVPHDQIPGDASHESRFALDTDLGAAVATAEAREGSVLHRYLRFLTHLALEHPHAEDVVPVKEQDIWSSRSVPNRTRLF